MQRLLLTRILTEFNNDNDQLFKFIIVRQTGAKEGNITYLDRGSYGVVYVDKTVNVIYKCQKIFDREQFIDRKYSRTRQMYPHEQKMHMHIYQYDNSLTCRIFDPIIFGPLLIIRLEFLADYVGLNVIRKTMNHDNAYFDKMQVVLQSIITKTQAITAANVYHGDHKDNNIMVSKDNGHVKIIDFGKSKFFDDVKQLNMKYLGQNTESRIDAFQNYHYSSIIQYIYSEQQCPFYFKLFKLIDQDSIYLTILHCLNKKNTHIFPYVKQKFGSKYDERQEQELFVAQFISIYGLELLLNLFMYGQCQNGSAKPQKVLINKITFDKDQISSQPSYNDLIDLVEYCEINQDSLETPRFFKCFMRTRKGKFYMSIYITNALSQWIDGTVEDCLDKANDSLAQQIKDMAIDCSLIDKAIAE